MSEVIQRGYKVIEVFVTTPDDLERAINSRMTNHYELVNVIKFDHMKVWLVVKLA